MFMRKIQSKALDSFLEWCIDIIDRKKHSVRGHFRHVQACRIDH